MSIRTIVPALAVLALIPAAPAAADQPIAEIGRESPVAAYGGWEAWSAFDEASGTYALTLRDPQGAVKAAPLAHPANAFVRVPLTGGAPEEVRTLRDVTGAFAKPAANDSIYVERQGGEEAGCDGFTDVPCRLVYVSSSPWVGERTLTPEAQVAYTGQPHLGQALTFVGGVFQQTVAGNSVVRTTALAGITVELYRRVGTNPERFEPTGARGVTNADGHFDIVLPAVGAQPWYTAVATTPGVATWAGRGTVGSVAP